MHPESHLVPKLSPGLVEAQSSGTKLDAEHRVELSRHIQERQRCQQLKQETYGHWCNMLYRLSLANYFRDDILWFPHNIDFRGRAYPLAALLNHMGPDLPRSLMVFAKGKPLGEEGFAWLKLHTVNLTGLMKKKSIEERKQFAEEMLPEILDSAERPIEGRR